MLKIVETNYLKNYIFILKFKSKKLKKYGYNIIFLEIFKNLENLNFVQFIF